MQLNFLKSGQGEPIILLHGMFGSTSNLGMVARALSQHFTVYSLDLRNHGKSPHAGRMDYPSMAADVLRFMDGQALSSAHILGHSMGGKTAMQLALNQAQRVNNLIVADIAPVTYQHEHSNVLSGLAALAAASLRSRQQADEILAQHVEDAGVRGFLLKNLNRHAAGDYKLLLNLHAIKANYDELAKGNFGTPFSGEALFVKGGQSDYLTTAHRDAVLELFPNAQLQIIVNAGHWLHAEQPQQFNKIVLQFLGV